MIGSPEVEVTGIYRSGNVLSLLHDGAWVGAEPTASMRSPQAVR